MVGWVTVLEERQNHVTSIINVLNKDMCATVEAIRAQIIELNNLVNVLVSVVGSTGSGDAETPTGVRVAKP